MWVLVFEFDGRIYLFIRTEKNSEIVFTRSKKLLIIALVIYFTGTVPFALLQKRRRNLKPEADIILNMTKLLKLS